MKQGTLLDQENSELNFNLILDDITELERIFHNPGINPVWSMHAGQLPFARFCIDLHPYDRLLIALCLAAHVFPEKLRKWTDSQREGIAITNYKLGGFISAHSAKFIPTLQTAIYLCSGENQLAAIEARKYYFHNSSILKRQVVLTEPFTANEKITDRSELVILLSEEYLDHLLYDSEIRPDFGKNFPAKLVETDKTWKDLVLAPMIISQLNNVGAWLKIEDQFNSSVGQYFRKGITCLFYGPPGTGKTLTAILLGKKHNRRVFRVDLSLIVDKYIGETEKKLATLFDRMEMFPGSIILFDESDVLFGKRTQVGDSKDRWANLLTAYLLQRIEGYPGICILTTNRKYDIDTAMLRRFDAMISFQNSDFNSQHITWKKLLPEGFCFEENITDEMLNTFKFTAGEIENIMKWGTIAALINNENIIRQRIINIYGALELAKHGITPPQIAANGNKSK